MHASHHKRIDVRHTEAGRSLRALETVCHHETSRKWHAPPSGEAWVLFKVRSMIRVDEDPGEAPSPGVEILVGAPDHNAAESEAR